MSICVIWEGDKCRSRDKQSDTILSSPGNHWLYSMALTCCMRRVRCRAASSLHVVSVSSSDCSLKFDFRSQPTAVVLSPMASKHENGGIRRATMSSQIHTMLERNSRNFMCARARRCDGISHRHAIPLALYPPRPCLQESER